ncbi:alpha/beta fold hydrolase [Glaciimonas sp. PCH181]|uniref:alpha/beta fold hydrolase n=1 Tax=Glaciimonas sp. PCH181 TaxID=2133943 RepID=UPI000D36EB30|nr:alpha/beta hydrolase [Glaciimonas sp. PCH181]PUA19518.1 hypothetical protein C7W93_06580 [Glaciimonas sp. PCH181]
MRLAAEWIALPGTLMDAASMQALSDALGQSLRVEVLGEESSFEAELERLARLTTSPAIWIGHSLGGIAALHLAIRQPQHCLALIIIASNSRPDGSAGPQRRAEQVAQLERDGIEIMFRQQLAPLYGLTGEGPLCDSLIRQAKRVGIDRFRKQLGYAAERSGLLPLSTLTMPVLALSGENDVVCPPIFSEEIMAYADASRSSHHSRAGVGHLLPVLDAPWCARHIQYFLNELPG